MAVLRTEFLIADNAQARWVRRSEATGHFVTVEPLHGPPAAPAHPQGVVFESGGARFNLEERHEAAAHRRHRFAEALAEAINARVARGQLDRLCLVAPARTLSAIQSRLTPEAAGKVAHVLAKDLTKTPDESLGRWLQTFELN